MKFTRFPLSRSPAGEMKRTRANKNPLGLDGGKKRKKKKNTA